MASTQLNRAMELGFLLLTESSYQLEPKPLANELYWNGL